MDTEVVGSRRDRIVVDNPRGGNKMWLWILIIVLVAAIGAGAYFFMNRNAEEGSASDLTPTEAPAEDPSPTEEEVDLTAFEVQVLNGSETEGEAGKLRTALEDAGFTVSGVGNADKSDYTTTIVQAKSSVSSGFIAKLKEELGKTYELGSDEELEDDNENDVVVIIGMPAEEEEEASDEADTEDTEEEASPTPEPTTAE